MATIALTLAGVAMAADDVVHPTRLTLGVEAFAAAETVRSTQPGTQGDVEVLDYEAFRTSNGKFDAGTYAVSGPHRFEIEQPYGVDEFMYFLEGGVTLVSRDGARMDVRAGDAVVIPSNWRGTWESQGYRKIYVIYSATKPIE